jgi:hypothetical protein
VHLKGHGGMYSSKPEDITCPICIITMVKHWMQTPHSVCVRGISKYTPNYLFSGLELKDLNYTELRATATGAYILESKELDNAKFSDICSVIYSICCISIIF